MHCVSTVRLIVLGILLAGGATACASVRAGAPAPAGTVQVRERDFQIVLRHGQLSPGMVRFDVRNAGPDDHELILVRDRERTLPLRLDGLTVNEEALQRVTIAALEPAGPGADRRLRLRLAKGRYEVFCNMAGHYMAGMHATFVVG